MKPLDLKIQNKSVLRLISSGSVNGLPKRAASTAVSVSLPLQPSMTVPSCTDGLLGDKLLAKALAKFDPEKDADVEDIILLKALAPLSFEATSWIVFESCRPWSSNDDV